MGFLPDRIRSISYSKTSVPVVESVYSCIIGMDLMKNIRGDRRNESSARNPSVARATSISSLICLLLLFLVTFVQVVHVHPAAADADHCPICVVMHSAAPVAVVAAAIVFVRSVSSVPVPVLHSVVRPWHCSLFNRPPPSQA